MRRAFVDDNDFHSVAKGGWGVLYGSNKLRFRMCWRTISYGGDGGGFLPVEKSMISC